MSIESFMTLAAALTTITGHSLPDVVGYLNRSDDKEFMDLSVVRLLSVFESPDDPLTGLWDLNRWDYIGENHSQFYVMGHLALMYKVPDVECWKGAMYLKYCRTSTEKGWWAKHRGGVIEGAYSIEFERKTKTTFEGTSTQIYRKPEKELMHSGEFKKVHVENGKIICEFENTNSKGKAKAVFHQRKRWKEMDTTLLF